MNMTARSKFVFDLNGTLMLAGMYAAMDMGLSLSAYGLSTMPSKGTLVILILFKLFLLATTILKGSLLIASLMCSKKDIKR